MSASEWVTVVLAFVGAGVGSGLSFWAARKGTRQQEAQGKREEWGRRFTGALGYLTVPDARGRDLGRVLLAGLAQSELASPEDRQLAEAVLSAEVRYGVGGVDVETVTSGESLDEFEFMEDDEINEGDQP